MKKFNQFLTLCKYPSLNNETLPVPFPHIQKVAYFHAVVTVPQPSTDIPVVRQHHAQHILDFGVHARITSP